MHVSINNYSNIPLLLLLLFLIPVVMDEGEAERQTEKPASWRTAVKLSLYNGLEHNAVTYPTCNSKAAAAAAAADIHRRTYYNPQKRRKARPRMTC